MAAKNVLGGELRECSCDPMTGYFRDGFCHTAGGDQGIHTVCTVMTEDFLRYTASRGNDLSTSRPEYSFPGLKPGDRWCLCAMRWKQAFDDGMAPKVILEATAEATLEFVNLEDLQEHAMEL